LFSLDYEWYLQNQIVGPVQRLCDPIEGTDSGRIADCLGLDSARYKQAQAYAQFEQEEVKTLDSQISDEERFRDVERWTPKCRHCQHSAEFELLRRTSNDVLPTCGLICPNEECKQLMPTASLQAQLMDACRSHVSKYEQSWLLCDDLSCGNKTRSISVYGKRCLVRGCKGVMKLEYSDTKLFTQLSYYESLVDVERLGVKLEGKDDRGE
jgi:DNA polymerase alpha subunit A